jgi:CBS domain-containing protein
MKVKEVMNEAIAVDKDISVREAAKIMTDKGIGSLIAVKGQEVFGIITEKDITKAAASGDLGKKMSGFMSKQVFTVDVEENLEDVAEMMAKNRVKHLPVVDEESHKLVGIITSSEIIQHVDDVDEDFFF